MIRRAQRLALPSNGSEPWVLSPENAIYNAAAYASFAAHVARGKDERFGDGRQTE